MLVKPCALGAEAQTADHIVRATFFFWRSMAETLWRLLWNPLWTWTLQWSHRLLIFLETSSKVSVIHWM